MHSAVCLFFRILGGAATLIVLFYLGLLVTAWL